MKKHPVYCMVSIVIMVVSLCPANAQWVPTGGPKSGTISALTVSGGAIFAGSDDFVDGGVFLSTDTGATWTPVNTGIEKINVNTLLSNGSAIYTGGGNIFYGNGVFQSTDKGSSWTSVNDGLGNKKIWSLIVNGGNILAGTYDNGIFISTTNGTNWIPAKCDVPQYSFVNSFAVSGGAVFAGTSSIFVGTTNAGVHKSTDNGATWAPVNDGPADCDVYALTAIGSTVFAGTKTGIFLSTDGGANWTPVNDGLTNTDVLSLAAIGGNLFAGCAEGGVFLSTNGGTRWTPINDGLSKVAIRSFAVIGNNLFAGTYGNGVWRRPLSDIVAIMDKKPVSEELHQAKGKLLLSKAGNSYTLRFSLSHSERVFCEIYSISGHQIESLVNKHFEAGSYRVTWNTRTIPAGCYIIKMQAGLSSFAKSITISR